MSRRSATALATRASARTRGRLRGGVVALAMVACAQEMRDQDRVDPLEAAGEFIDGAGGRALPEGVVPRGAALPDDPRETGRDSDGAFVGAYPFPIGAADLERGAERYGIYCAPCHGLNGDGDGIVARRGFPAPLPFSAAPLRGRSRGELFAVIREGRAMMPDYDHLPRDDRWRIVAWLEVLRFAQRAPIERLAPDERLAEGRR